MTSPPVVRCPATVLDEIRRHVGTDVSVEHGGILVGEVDAGVIEVHGAVPAHSAESTATALTFTPEAWAEVEDGRLTRFPNSRVVGWFHSHPRFGIFLSNHDRYIHENFFDAPYHLAYVVDPVSACDGFFGWSGEELVRLPEWQVVNAGAAIAMRSAQPDATPDVPVHATPLVGPALPTQPEVEPPAVEPIPEKADQGSPAPAREEPLPQPEPIRWPIWVLAVALGCAFVLGLIVGRYLLPDRDDPSKDTATTTTTTLVTPPSTAAPSVTPAAENTTQPASSIPATTVPSTATTATPPTPTTAPPLTRPLNGREIP